jgi:hypothetical protein
MYEGSGKQIIIDPDSGSPTGIEPSGSGTLVYTLSMMRYSKLEVNICHGRIISKSTSYMQTQYFLMQGRLTHDKNSY